MSAVSPTTFFDVGGRAGGRRQIAGKRTDNANVVADIVLARALKQINVKLHMVDAQYTKYKIICVFRHVDLCIINLCDMRRKRNVRPSRTSWECHSVICMHECRFDAN